MESSRTPGVERPRRVEARLSCVTAKMAAADRARQGDGQLQVTGVTAFDARNPVCIENACADVLLITDDRLRARTLRENARLTARVENPAKCHPEALEP